MLRSRLPGRKGQAPMNKIRGLLRGFVEIDCQNSFFLEDLCGGWARSEGVT